MSGFNPSPEKVAEYERLNPPRPTWSISSWRANCRVTHVWDDPSICKPREECQPFTFAFYEPSGYDAARSVKAQEKFVKQLETLRKKEAREAKARAKRLKVAA